MRIIIKSISAKIVDISTHEKNYFKIAGWQIEAEIRKLFNYHDGIEEIIREERFIWKDELNIEKILQFIENQNN